MAAKMVWLFTWCNNRKHCMADSALKTLQSQTQPVCGADTCSNFTFTSGKAEKDFGFQPKYSGEKAIQDTIRYYSQKR